MLQFPKEFDHELIESYWKMLYWKYRYGIKVIISYIVGSI